MWPFSRKALLDPEMVDWMFDHAAWLLTAHARAGAFASAQLIPVADRMFPKDGFEGHALAEHLLDRVLGYMQMRDLRLTLTEDPHSGRFADTGNGYQPRQRSMAAGTYRRAEGEITYDVSLLKRPVHLVAVLSHEVAHAVLDLGARAAPPSDSEFDELLTDFTSVFLGFGFYQTAFRRPVHVSSVETADEFRSYYAFYMNRREACFATALFAVVHEIDPSLVLRGAVEDTHGTLKRAFRDLDADADRVARLRQAVAARRADR